MSIVDLFNSKLNDTKPLAKKTSNVSAPVPMHQLFSKNHNEPVAVAEPDVQSLLSLKLVNVPSHNNKPVESEDVSKVASDLEHVRSLNAKYIQVINQINEELMKLKSDATKTNAENASLKKENNDLSKKVSELSNAVLNVVQQNKTLSRALGLRS